MGPWARAQWASGPGPSGPLGPGPMGPYYGPKGPWAQWAQWARAQAPKGPGPRAHLELGKNKSCASKFHAERRSRNIQSSAMCQKTTISVYGNLRVCLMFCPPGGRGSGRPGVGGLGGRSPPMETPPDEDWEFVWVPLHAWAEIRSSPKIPLSTIGAPLRGIERGIFQAISF